MRENCNFWIPDMFSGGPIQELGSICFFCFFVRENWNFWIPDMFSGCPIQGLGSICFFLFFCKGKLQLLDSGHVFLGGPSRDWVPFVLFCFFARENCKFWIPDMFSGGPIQGRGSICFFFCFFFGGFILFFWVYFFVFFDFSIWAYFGFVSLICFFLFFNFFIDFGFVGGVRLLKQEAETEKILLEPWATNTEGLNPEQTTEGMKQEIRSMKAQQVYTEVSYNTLTQEQRNKIIKSRWVLRQKGNTVRARIVAKGYTEDGKDNDDVYASTPIFCVLRQ